MPSPGYPPANPLGAPQAPAPKRAAETQSPLGTPEKAATSAARSGATQQGLTVDKAPDTPRKPPKMKKALLVFGGTGGFGGVGPVSRS